MEPTSEALKTVIEFVSASNPGGGGTVTPQTGDIISLVLIIIAVLAAICSFTYFAFVKRKIKAQQKATLTRPNAAMAMSKSKILAIAILIIAILSFFGITFSYTTFASAFSQNEITTADTIKAYVDESTGEITFDDGWIMNNSASDIYVYKSQTKLAEGSEKVEGLDNINLKIEGLEGVFFDGKLGSEYSYDGSTIGLKSGKQTPVKFSQEGLTIETAKKLIGNIAFETYLYPEVCYSVTYHENGATSGTAPKSQILDNNTLKEITISGKESLAKSQHTFTGWNTKPDGSGDSYLPGVIYATLANLDLYAQWEPIPISSVEITFTNKTEGMGNIPETQIVDIGTTYSVNSTDGTLTFTSPENWSWTPKPVAGYVFDKWEIGGATVTGGELNVATQFDLYYKEGSTPPVPPGKIAVNLSVDSTDNAGTIDGSTAGKKQIYVSKDTTFNVTKSGTDAGKIIFTEPNENEVITVTVTPLGGNHFEKWCVGDDTTAAWNGKISEETNIFVHFRSDSETVTIHYKVVNTDPAHAHGYLTKNGQKNDDEEYIYEFDEEVLVSGSPKGATAHEFTYEPDANTFIYYFTKWTIEGDDTWSSTDANLVPTKEEGTYWADNTIYVAHFATPKATYTDNNSTMTFTFDESDVNEELNYDYNERAMYFPVRPDTHYAGGDKENDGNVYPYWCNNDGTQKVYPRTVIFEESFKDYKGLKSTSFWFWNPLNNAASISVSILPAPGQPGEEQAVPAVIPSQRRVLQSVKGLDNIYTEDIEETAWMFGSYCYNPDDLGSLKDFITGEINTNEQYDAELTSLDFSSWNTPKNKNTANMFFGCYALKDLKLPNETDGHSFGANVLDMTSMFQHCSSLTSFEIHPNFGSKVEHVKNMFAYCLSLYSINIPASFGTKVSILDSMFEYCVSLNNVTINGGTSEETSFGGAAISAIAMFRECYTLRTFTINSKYFGVHIEKFKEMFYQCYQLRKIDLSNFTTHKQKDDPEEEGWDTEYVGNMLYHCNALEEFVISDKWKEWLFHTGLFDWEERVASLDWWNEGENYNDYPLECLPYNVPGTTEGYHYGSFITDSPKALYSASNKTLTFINDHVDYSKTEGIVEFGVRLNTGYKAGGNFINKQYVRANREEVNDVVANDIPYGYYSLANINGDLTSLYEEALLNVLNTLVFPDWYEYNITTHKIKCLVPEAQTVIFDDTFSQLKGLRSTSCWFIADSDGVQPYQSFKSGGENSLENGFNNLPQSDLETVASTFGGFNLELVTPTLPVFNEINNNMSAFDSLSWQLIEVREMLRPNAKITSSKGRKGTIETYSYNPSPLITLHDTYGSSITELDLSTFIPGIPNDWRIQRQIQHSGALTVGEIQSFAGRTDYSGICTNCLGLTKVTFITVVEDEFPVGGSFSFPNPGFGFMGAFCNCSKLTELVNINSMCPNLWCGQGSIYLYRAFDGCNAITSLDLSEWSFPQRAISQQFYYGSEYIYVDNFETGKMFNGCDNISEIKIGQFWFPSMYDCSLIDTSNQGCFWRNADEPGVEFTTYDIPYNETLGYGVYGTYTRENVASTLNKIDFDVSDQNAGELSGQTEDITFATPVSFYCYENNLIVNNKRIYTNAKPGFKFTHWTLNGKMLTPETYTTVQDNIQWIYPDSEIGNYHFVAHFTGSDLSPKAVYKENVDGYGNTLTFYYDNLDHSNEGTVFNVIPNTVKTYDPEYDKQYVRLPDWFELSYTPTSNVTGLFKGLNKQELGKNVLYAVSAGNAVVSSLKSSESKLSDGSLQEYDNIWRIKWKISPESVIFDDTFKNYEQLRSISMWFMADMFNNQTIKKFYSGSIEKNNIQEGFKNLYTSSLVDTSYAFGGLFGSDERGFHALVSLQEARSVGDQQQAYSNYQADAMAEANEIDNALYSSVSALEVLANETKSRIDGVLYGVNGETYGNSIENLNLTGFNFKNVESMAYMFANAVALKHITFDDNLDTSNIEDMSGVFANCESLGPTTSDAISNWSRFTTTKARCLDYLFFGCSNFTELDLSNLTTENVSVTMRGIQGNIHVLHQYSQDSMFTDCVRLNKFTINTVHMYEQDRYNYLTGWTLNMGNSGLEQDISNPWINNGNNVNADYIPCYDPSSPPETTTEVHTGTFTRQSALDKSVNLVSDENGSISGGDSYVYVNNAQILTSGTEPSTLFIDNRQFKAIPNENYRFKYWTIETAIGKHEAGDVLPNNHRFTVDRNMDVNPVVIKAHFELASNTAQATLIKKVDGSSVTDVRFVFSYGTEPQPGTDESVVATYTINPDTSDFVLPPWYRKAQESWYSGDNHPIPKFQLEFESVVTQLIEAAPGGTNPRVKIQFDDSFKNYNELRSMSCWFMPALSNYDETKLCKPFAFDQEHFSGLANINTSILENVAYMFAGSEYFNEINGWMEYHMDSDVRVPETVQIDLSDLDVYNMSNIDFMFANCLSKLEVVWPSPKNIERNLSSMNYAFYNCPNTTDYTKVLGGLDTSQIGSMSYAFARLNKKDIIGDPDIDQPVDNITLTFPDSFNTTSVWNFEGVFAFISNTKKLIIKQVNSERGNAIPNFDTSNASNFASLFEHDWYLEEIEIEGANITTINANDTSRMFSECAHLKADIKVDANGNETCGVPSSLRNLDKVQYMSDMFYGCQAMEEFNWPRNYITDEYGTYLQTIYWAEYAFSNCYNLKTVDLTNYNFSGYDTPSHMFFCTDQNGVRIPSSVTSFTINYIGVWSVYDRPTGLNDLGLYNWYDPYENGGLRACWLTTSADNTVIYSIMENDEDYVYMVNAKSPSDKQTFTLATDYILYDLSYSSNWNFNEHENLFMKYAYINSVHLVVPTNDNYSLTYTLSNDNKVENTYYKIDFECGISNKSSGAKGTGNSAWIEYSSSEDIIYCPYFAWMPAEGEPVEWNEIPNLPWPSGADPLTNTLFLIVKPANVKLYNDHQAAPAQNAAQALAQDQKPAEVPQNAFDKLTDATEPVQEVAAAALSVITLPMPWTIFTLFMDIVF